MQYLTLLCRAPTNAMSCSSAVVHNSNLLLTLSRNGSAGPGGDRNRSNHIHTDPERPMFAVPDPIAAFNRGSAYKNLSLAGHRNSAALSTWRNSIEGMIRHIEAIKLENSLPAWTNCEKLQALYGEAAAYGAPEHVLVSRRRTEKFVVKWHRTLGRKGIM